MIDKYNAWKHRPPLKFDDNCILDDLVTSLALTNSINFTKTEDDNISILDAHQEDEDAAASMLMLMAEKNESI